MLEKGKVLQGRYRIVKQIGEGGMGAVYLASDERFNSTVAIKETLLSDENFIKAFKREARLLNSLRHTALPKVTDHFIEDKGQFIVMEYIPGDDLFEMLEKRGEAFPLEDVINWTEQLLEALEYLHNQENPVIHRDIKPQNLKLTSHGKIILLDFGLAKGNPTDANHQTAANSIFGYSRNYASLEQIQGTGTDPRSDFYSLAATLYHLVTGKPPADALTRVMLVLNEDEDPLIPAHLVHGQVSEHFSAFLERAMSLNANQRPQKASAMREMLFDKEFTSVSAKRRTSVNKPVPAEFLNQNTKIISGEGELFPTKKSEMKTEILSDEKIAGASVLTKIGDPKTVAGNKQDTNENAKIIPPASNSNSRRKIYGAASALGVLALVSGIFAMLYLADSGAAVNPRNAVESKALESNKPLNKNTNADWEIVNTGSDENTNSEIISVKTNSNVASEKPKADVAAKSSDGKIVEKSAKSKSSGKNSVDDEDEVIFREGKMITKDGTVITDDGRIILKDGTVISEKGISKDGVIVNPKQKVMIKPPKVPVNPNTGLPLTREQVERLTPAQKEKLRRAMEMQRREMQRRGERNRRPNTTEPPPPPPTLY